MGHLVQSNRADDAADSAADQTQPHINRRDPSQSTHSRDDDRGDGEGWALILANLLTKGDARPNVMCLAPRVRGIDS
jgi:hypothetical protein